MGYMLHESLTFNLGKPKSGFLRNNINKSLIIQIKRKWSKNRIKKSHTNFKWLKTTENESCPVCNHLRNKNNEDPSKNTTCESISITWRMTKTIEIQSYRQNFSITEKVDRAFGFKKRLYTTFLVIVREVHWIFEFSERKFYTNLFDM